MPSNPLLSLSSKGVLHSVAERLDVKFAYYLVSKASQSPLYQSGQVRSLAKSIQLTGNDPTALKRQIEEDLTFLYTGLFDNVQVTVTILDQASDGTNRLAIQMDIIVTDQGTSYSAGAQIYTINGVVQRLAELLNNGIFR